jgi:RNA polymerase sigma-70 factor (ECF subfamily)
MSDEDLVRQALAGRSEAYAELVRRWASRVLSLCRALVGSAHTAEDLAQDAFLAGYRSLASLVRPEKFGAWLCTIARHSCQNWLKAQARDQVPFSTLTANGNPDHLLVPNAFPDPSAQEQTERLEKLRAAVADLPSDCREVLLLYYEHDLTYRDLAQLLRVSPATINARLTRARNLLRERFGVCRR